MRRRVLGVVALVGLAWWLWPDPAPAPRAEPGLTPAPSSARTVGRAVQQAPSVPSGSLEPRDVVECELTEPLRADWSSVGVVEHTPGTLEPIGLLRAEQVDGWIRFHPTHAEGLGQLVADEYDPVAIAWVNGACLELVEPKPVAETRIVVTLEGEVPDGAQVFSTCSPSRETSLPDGGVEIRTSRREPCDVGVGYVLGSYFLDVWSRTVHPSGDALHVTAPEPGPIPAPGWAIMPQGGRLVVEALDPDGAAAAAGVQVGDEILDVGGGLPSGNPREVAHALHRLGAGFEVALLRGDLELTLRVEQ